MKNSKKILSNKRLHWSFLLRRQTEQIFNAKGNDFSLFGVCLFWKIISPTIQTQNSRAQSVSVGGLRRESDYYTLGAQYKTSNARDILLWWVWEYTAKIPLRSFCFQPEIWISKLLADRKGKTLIKQRTQSQKSSHAKIAKA